MHKNYPSEITEENKDKVIDLYDECHKRFGDKILNRAKIINANDKNPLDELNRSLDTETYIFVFTEIDGEFNKELYAELSNITDAYNLDKNPDNKSEILDFDTFKTDSNGLVPCIAQDYKTGKVLMMAYMNKESYEKTIKTGLMTYWSRSRQKLWTKGEESGHFQHMHSLIIDCDKDTILAKVRQEGPACHTGNPTCFFTPLVEKNPAGNSNPLSVFEDVYNVILDRKKNPKEGSYTNYLFDKGIDKILKKVGEECTEIVIAAKNPDPEEIKYEMADFLYHAMVLMVERGVTWEDITDELANRE
ncbi:MAG: bifunctional phosphoribosyl-AMP cyclohydrolase/phosphoribosyl-ATP diphosphatase HisIE [Eubacterium sp.]|nr:bifunctional phosphoribosyl-AMP cyclohydrolase/phosphoribosyl-ATP diphosphatase HisIE [Eubacterium sp.]